MEIMVALEATKRPGLWKTIYPLSTFLKVEHMFTKTKDALLLFLPERTKVIPEDCLEFHEPRGGSRITYCNVD